jgi:hypothetical protein
MRELLISLHDSTIDSVISVSLLPTPFSPKVSVNDPFSLLDH